VVAQAVDEHCEDGAGRAHDLVKGYGYHASIMGNHQLCPPHTREEQQGADYREIFEIAMLIVKRKEKAIKIKLSRLDSVVACNTPSDIKIQHPVDAEPVWRAVRSHGYANYHLISYVVLRLTRGRA
jgi:hypothetical protein